MLFRSIKLGQEITRCHSVSAAAASPDVGLAFRKSVTVVRWFRERVFANPARPGSAARTARSPRDPRNRPSARLAKAARRANGNAVSATTVP